MMDREQLVRERAYAIWEAEGCPPHSEREHWERAMREINEQERASPSTDDVTVDGAATRTVSAEPDAPPESAAGTAPTARPKRATKGTIKPAVPGAARGKTGKTRV
jgi:hypothetical protein